jgi:hypothetical protein
MASCGVLCAQPRENTIGVKVDVVGGGTNRPEGFSLSGPPRSFGSFIGTYPSIDVTSRGEHSALDISYTLGLSRFHSDGNIDSISQTASLRFSRILNPKWKLNLSELFMMTPDYSTFNVLRGVVETPEGFRYLLDRVAVRRSNQFNNVTFGADHELSTKSTLSLSASHSFTRYPDAAGFRNSPDQQRAAAEVKYLRRRSERTTWNVGYTGSYLRVNGFESAQSHALSIGFSRRLSPSFVFSASAGPSHGRSPGQSHGSYNSSLRLETLLKSNTFFVYYRHDGADTSGWGSISDSNYAGLGMIHPLGRKASLSIDASAYETTYETRATIGNVYRSRGTSAAATLGRALSRAWTLNLGGLYQRQNQSSIYRFEEQRVFVSLRYHNPEPWEFLK